MQDKGKAKNKTKSKKPITGSAYARCEWCGDLVNNKKGGMYYSFQGSFHTERARVCSSECGKAWQRKAAERAKMIDEKFKPYRSYKLTVEE